MPEVGVPLMEGPAATEVEARVEQLLRDAHLQRLRRHWAEAESLCREALELAPDDPMGLEMLGDLLADKGSLDEALEAYRKAFERQPHKTALEEKIARVVLERSEEARARQEAEMLLRSPLGKLERRRNVTVAILLSILWPGAGQIFVNREYVKGGILVGVWGLALTFGLGELFKAMLAFSGMLERGATVNGPLAVVGLVGILVYIYGLLDASATAGRAGRSSREV